MLPLQEWKHLQPMRHLLIGHLKAMVKGLQSPLMPVVAAMTELGFTITEVLEISALIQEIVATFGIRVVAVPIKDGINAGLLGLITVVEGTGILLATRVQDLGIMEIKTFYSTTIHPALSMLQVCQSYLRSYCGTIVNLGGEGYISFVKSRLGFRNSSVMVVLLRLCFPCMQLLCLLPVL